uniref:Acyl-CoA thioesterase II domain-containing protein n=1 Tax=Parascaris univalens TaxID=6257 RepID=A0A915ACY1_PARUN
MIVHLMLQISFHKRERDSIRHETPPPNVVGPENLKNIQTLMTEATADDTSRIDEVHRRIIQHKFAELLPTLTKDFEVRPIDGERYIFKKLDPTMNLQLHIWLKAREHIGDDFFLQRCLAAYVSDSMMMETSLLPHLGRKFIPSMVFSLDHSLWFHKPEFHIDDWMLFETESP